jgi:hypothetical protein
VLRIHTHTAKNHYFGPPGSLEVIVQLPRGLARSSPRPPAPSSAASAD